MTGAFPLKILIESGTANGVEYLRRGKSFISKSKREIIDCCGAIKSPHLLMLSGIGDSEQLKSQNIEVHSDLTGVERNLKDHPIFPISYSLKDTKSLNTLLSRLGLVQTVLKYISTKSGPLALGAAHQGGFDDLESNGERADFQLQYQDGLLKLIPQLKKFQKPTILNPKSTGIIELISSNPREDPKINLNYFHDSEDIKFAVKAYRYTQRLFATSSLGSVTGTSLKPENSLEIDEYIKENIETCYHPVGTCKMGNDEWAVVDHELKVYDVKNLRVVDASIMPSIIRGNTNAPTIMIAEKASAMIVNGN